MSTYDEGVHLEAATIANQFQVNDVSGLNEPTDNIWNDPDTGVDPVTSLPNPTDRVTGTSNNGQFNWYYRTVGGIYNPLDAGMTSLIINALDETAGTVDCMDISDRQSGETRFGATVGDSLQFDFYEDENLWMAKKYAYESISRDTALLADTDFQNFFLREDSLNTGKFSAIKSLSADSATYRDASEINELIDEEIDLEGSLKSVNTTYLNKYSSEEGLNGADSSGLEVISDLPYFSGGEAIYYALGMLGKEGTPSLPALRLAEPIHLNDSAKSNISASCFIYPNPASNVIYIQSTSGKINKIEIFDAQLRLLFTKEGEMENTPIEFYFKPGIYNVKLQFEDGICSWKKLIKL
ncbi:MAG: T9SS type A sorting domain-containing protein [Bacteroidota bacterium]|nr:T9SS type A sorting domain-containing protein [Bacteroidota bacterium]